jgi:hypothetical protein
MKKHLLLTKKASELPLRERERERERRGLQTLFL